MTVTIRKHLLQRTVECLMDLGKNRVPGTDALTIVRTKRAVGKVYGEYLETRDELIKQSDPPTENGWPDGTAPKELLDALTELMNEFAEIELEPLDLDGLVAAGIEVEPDSLGLLLDLGIVTDGSEPKLEAVKDEEEAA